MPICKRCNKEFQGVLGKRYCPKCAAEKMREGWIKIVDIYGPILRKIREEVEERRKVD
jgi:RNA polymerase subunit RPABC4/transcription elongation factor Spt4